MRAIVRGEGDKKQEVRADLKWGREGRSQGEGRREGGREGGSPEGGQTSRARAECEKVMKRTLLSPLRTRVGPKDPQPWHATSYWLW